MIRMKIKLIFLIFVMCMPLSGSAMPDLQHHDKESKIVKNYMDSLSLLKMRDSGSIQIPAGCTYERLFVPMTFYNNIIHNQFQDRKSTRLNSSHQIISYAVFCLKKKK